MEPGLTAILSRKTWKVLFLLFWPLGILVIGADHWLASASPAAPATAARFGVIGDYGSDGQNEADVSALVHGWNPDFIITVGDNNYGEGCASTIDANIG